MRTERRRARLEDEDGRPASHFVDVVNGTARLRANRDGRFICRVYLGTSTEPTDLSGIEWMDLRKGNTYLLKEFRVDPYFFRLEDSRGAAGSEVRASGGGTFDLKAVRTGVFQMRGYYDRGCTQPFAFKSGVPDAQMNPGDIWQQFWEHSTPVKD